MSVLKIELQRKSLMLRQICAIGRPKRRLHQQTQFKRVIYMIQTIWMLILVMMKMWMLQLSVNVFVNNLLRQSLQHLANTSMYLLYFQTAN